MKLPLLTRIAIAVLSASVACAVLVFVVSLAELAPAPSGQQLAGTVAKPTPQTTAIERSGRAAAPAQVERPA